MPSLGQFLYHRFRNGSIPPLFVPIALLSLADLMMIGVAFAFAGLAFVLNFRCPRCHKRFLALSAANKACRNCGLPLGALSDPNVTVDK